MLLLARVRECHIVEREDGRRELVNVLTVEPERFGLSNEASRLHLVDDLLLRFGLPDKVGVCTS